MVRMPPTRSEMFRIERPSMPEFTLRVETAGIDGVNCVAAEHGEEAYRLCVDKGDSTGGPYASAEQEVTDSVELPLALTRAEGYVLKLRRYS
jgi:hypothetical protein